MSTSSISIGDLVPRVYGDFRGIDATKRDVTLTRSPDTKNMWIDYKNTLGKCIETRPGMKLFKGTDNTVYKTFQYTIGTNKHLIVHCGTKLYDIFNGTTTEIFTGMNVKNSYFFVYNNILYIKDGINYLTYNGTTCTAVEGYIPRTSISGNPKTGSRTTYEWVNMISPYRKNTFCGDGESTSYKLDVETIDTDYVPTITVDDVAKTVITDFTVDYDTATINFVTAPAAPLTDGADNVVIKFKKRSLDNENKVKYSSLTTIFNEQVFISGNADYPNVMWHSREQDPTYFPDTNYNNEGLDSSPVKALINGNNALWAIKKGSQANTTAFYHTPVYTTDPDRGISIYEYSATHSSISLGCVSTGINFNDDIVFFSERGMEGVSSDITTEQFIAHRSSLVDALLLNEENYEKMILTEWEGYLLVCIDNKVYLANSQNQFTNNNHVEYDWFYWELEKNITSADVIDGTLYLGTADGIYTLDDTSSDRTIESYWTTPEDEFKVGQYQKTTSKKGCVVNMKGDSVTISTKTDNNEYEEIGTYTNTKEYVVPRIKKKKWKSIQIKFSSNKPFGLFSCQLQAYVGGYVKR